MMRIPDRPRLRASVTAVLDDGLLHLTCLADRTVYEYEVEDWVGSVVAALDGTHDLSDISRLCDRTIAEVVPILEILSDDGLLREGPPVAAADAWSRQLWFLDELGSNRSATEMHERLRGSHVAVVGVGGVGSWVVQSLVAVGVERFTFIDPDVVEESNLNRQVLFGLADVGRRKVDAAARSIRTRRPSASARLYGTRFEDVPPVAAAIREVDLVIGCADEPSVAEVSTAIAAVAHPLGVPHIVGGAYGAAVGAPGFTVVPGRTPCWQCATAASESAASPGGVDVRPAAAGSVGSFAPLIAMVGSVVAWEACRVLLGVETRLSSALREFDALTLDWHEVAVPMRAECGCVG